MSTPKNFFLSEDSLNGFDNHPALSGVAGGFRCGRGGGIFPLDGNQLRDARFLHRHSIHDRSHLHRLPIVGYHDELRLRAHLCQHFIEAPNVGLVERCVHFVKYAERAGLVAEHGNE